jgi:hypothetical protein
MQPNSLSTSSCPFLRRPAANPAIITNDNNRAQSALSLDTGPSPVRTTYNPARHPAPLALRPRATIASSRPPGLGGIRSKPATISTMSEVAPLLVVLWHTVWSNIRSPRLCKALTDKGDTRNVEQPSAEGDFLSGAFVGYTLRGTCSAVASGCLNARRSRWRAGSIGGWQFPSWIRVPSGWAPASGDLEWVARILD